MIIISLSETRPYQFHFVMFSFACTHSSTRFLIRRARRATSSWVILLRIYTQLCFSRGATYRRRVRWQTPSVAQVSLAFSRLRTFPSWIPFASLVYLLQILLPGQPSCTHKSLMASTSVLISCLLTVLTFHSRFPFLVVISCVVIVIPLSIIRLASFSSLRFTFVQCRFLLPPAKVNTCDTPNFSPFGAHAFYMIKEIWNSIIYTKSARPLYTC